MPYLIDRPLAKLFVLLKNIWGCFCIIYLAEYTANLTSSLTENDVGLKINGIHDPQVSSEHI